MIPDAAVQAVVVARYGYSAPSWQGRRDAIRRDLAAALPHLVTDEMVERAVSGYREVAGRCSRQAMRAALEAALGGAR